MVEIQSVRMYVICGEVENRSCCITQSEETIIGILVQQCYSNGLWWKIDIGYVQDIWSYDEKSAFTWPERRCSNTWAVVIDWFDMDGNICNRREKGLFDREVRRIGGFNSY